MKALHQARYWVGSCAVVAVLSGAALAQEAAPSPPASGKPANLCQELVAFVKQPEAANKAAATPPQQATAVSNPSGKTEGGKPADGGEPQKSAGLSGAINENGSGPGNPAVNPNAKANAAAKVPPAPAAPAPAPKPDPALVETIEAAAGANDLRACRAAARSMRTAGVALPPPLLALSALDLKFFER